MPEEPRQLTDDELDTEIERLQDVIVEQIETYMKLRGVKDAAHLAKLTTLNRSSVYKIMAKSSVPNFRSLLAIALALKVEWWSLLSLR